MVSPMRSRVIAAVFAFGAPSLVLAGVSSMPSAAEAGDPPKPAAKKTPSGSSASGSGDHSDPDNVTAISQYMETLMKGVEKYSAKDYTSAIDTFKKAIQLNPRHAFGRYLLGEAYLATGNLSEAEAAFVSAQEGSDFKNPTLRSHVLFAVADVYEREKKWEQAKTAWHAYSEHASKIGPDAGAFPLSGMERMKAIQKVIELEKAYVPVRERIAAERDAGVDSGKGKK